ncbi:MAG TPA: right-handed parallel beta-helix repeat-containing protein [Lacunisphaera sp.]|nr:right-handed parallel beta-helix repeat-containing protein [Lacunisphaera sp.]
MAGVLALVMAGPATAAEVRSRVIVTAVQGEEGIHAALEGLPTNGGIVELGAGTFTLSRPILLNRDGVGLRGRGADTRLVLAAKANCPVVVVGRVGTPPDRLVRRVTVRGLVIDGNRAAQEYECWGGPCDGRSDAALRNNGITIRGAEDIVIEDVATCRARSGGIVLEKHSRRIRLNRVEAFENEFDGVAAYETEESEFTALRLHHNRSAGFSFDWRFDGNRVADCEASDNGSQGIFMRDSNRNVFERVVLRNNGEQGLFIAETRTLPGTACRENRFVDLTITGNRTQGIRVNDASCKPNTLEASLVRDNRVEDISLAEFGQLEIVQLRTTME